MRIARCCIVQRGHHHGCGILPRVALSSAPTRVSKTYVRPREAGCNYGIPEPTKVRNRASARVVIRHSPDWLVIRLSVSGARGRIRQRVVVHFYSDKKQAVFAWLKNCSCARRRSSAALLFVSLEPVFLRVRVTYNYRWLRL